MKKSHYIICWLIRKMRFDGNCYFNIIFYEKVRFLNHLDEFIRRIHCTHCICKYYCIYTFVFNPYCCDYNTPWAELKCKLNWHYNIIIIIFSYYFSLIYLMINFLVHAMELYPTSSVSCRLYYLKRYKNQLKIFQLGICGKKQFWPYTILKCRGNWARKTHVWSNQLHIIIKKKQSFYRMFIYDTQTSSFGIGRIKC